MKKPRVVFTFKQITRHDRRLGHWTPVQTFEGEKTYKELHWCKKGNIYIQIAVWSQSEELSRKILGWHLAVVMDALYVCPWILRNILRGKRHGFDGPNILKQCYFKLNLSICFSNKYNIQEWQYASTLMIYILFMWVIWETGGLQHTRNFSNILGGIFYYVMSTATSLALPPRTNIPRPTKKNPKDTPNCVFNKLVWHQNYGTEGVPHSNGLETIKNLSH